MASVAKRKWTYQGKEREAWVVRYKDRAGVHRSRQFEQKKAAEKYKREVENELESGSHVARGASITMRAAGEEYLALLERRAEQRDVADLYVQVNRWHIELCMSRIGQVLATDLTWQTVVDLARYLLTVRRRSGDKQPLSRGTVSEIIATLGRVCSFAERRGYCAKNVVPLARAEMESFANEKVRSFLEHEVTQLFNAVEVRRRGYGEADRRRLRAMVYLAACCGLRRGEILGLTLDAVDFDHKRIHVRHSLLAASDRLKGPKTVSGYRTVPMPSLVSGALQEYLAYAKPDHRGLFFRTQRSAPIQPASLARSWKALLEQAGLSDGKPLRFHALRHYAGSAWLAGGVPLADVSRLLGHADVAITAEVYCHPISDPMASAARLEDCASAMATPRGQVLAITQELRNSA